MSYAMEENLESGWVSVRPNVFDEKEKHKIVFIVAWNDVEGKFAITCHNRTVQRRSIILGRDPPREQPQPGTTQLDQTKFPRSPVKDETPKSPAKAVTSDAVKGQSHKMSTSKVLYESSSTPEPSLARSPDFEVLEPVEDDPISDNLDLEELDIVGREDCSWAGLFSFQDLRTIHIQLCSVNSNLEPCLPVFPEEPTGMWTVLFGSAEVTETEMDDLCCQLQVYLVYALDTCGWKILSQVLFTESDDPEEYYESLSELRHSGYEEALQRAKKHLHELLEGHGAVDSMVGLMQVYTEEDAALGALLDASTQLYQYLLQPFRDMRELAMLRRQQIKISIENDYLGPRRIEGLKSEDCDWQRKAQEAVLNIQEFTVKYFEITAHAQKVAYERMRVDQRRMGKAAWSVAVERMETLRYSVAKETLQLQRAREICLEQRKHSLREEVQGLCAAEGAMRRLDVLEARYYHLQLQIYDIQAEILACEELLLTAQLHSIRRQMSERQDEVVYYDSVESPEALGAEQSAEREELRRLQLSARQLETRRGRITAKRSYLRHKRDVCVNSHEKQQSQQTGQQDASSPQGEEEEDEEKRKSRVRQERQNTLDRLRSFKQRYPGQVILKSTRLRVSQSRSRGEKGGRGETGENRDAQDRPRCLSAGVQTDPSPITDLTVSLPLIGSSRPDDSSPSSLLAWPVSSPPSPPPPPPPPPRREEHSPSGSPSKQGLGSGEEGKVAEVKVETVRPPLSPLGPFIPRFFDSSQLVSARKKLRKTTELEAQRRRVSSPMDEVLASLKRGSFHLRRVEQRPLQPPPGDDPNNILAQIRRGVKLRRVPPRERSARGELDAATDPLTRSIHEALRRIKEASPDSDSDDEGLACPDWES